MQVHEFDPSIKNFKKSSILFLNPRNEESENEILNNFTYNYITKNKFHKHKFNQKNVKYVHLKQ